jgi:hypothetical protein
LSGVILLLVLAVLAHLSVFFRSIDSGIAGGGIWSEWLLSWVLPTSLPGQWLAILLVFAQALLLNALANDHRLTAGLRNFVPGAVFIVLNSLYPEFLLLSPPLLANTFLLIAIAGLLRTYKKHEIAKDLYNAGFFIGAAALFCSSYALFILAAWAGWLALRGSKFGEVMMMLTGLMTPYFLSAVYIFVFSPNETLSWGIFLRNMSVWDFPDGFSLVALVKIGIWGLLILLVLFSINQYTFKKKIQAQKAISVMYWFLFLAGVSVVFQGSIQLAHLLIASIPLSLFLGLSFESARSAAAEIFFLLLVVCLFCFHMLGNNGLII